MLVKLDGKAFLQLLDSGIRNLEINKSALNDLNVFPVPDGDTGTNMVMTLKYGYEAVQGKSGTLSQIAGDFSTAAVFGARGNSGVIVSQFFKGLSEGFRDLEEADCTAFANALENGCKFAYGSVAKPVEGTMLTVVREAARAVSDALPLESIDAAVDVFLREAHVSLKNTPQLLPVLKKAGVVDSGGSGIVCFFEGVRKYLKGETIEPPQQTEDVQRLDFSRIHKDTDFSYGYCVESLLQLTRDVSDFDLSQFQSGLAQRGESVVTTLEQDKVKLHVHTKVLAPIMEYCQRYGEFLTMKIENMTVQNLQKVQPEEAGKFLYDSQREQGTFAVVAVAPNAHMQRMFFEMGADVVIQSEIAPSSQDFMDAFGFTAASRILVFPNSSNSILTAMQAVSLYKNARVTILNSRSLAECYAALSVMDFDCDWEEAESAANDTLSAIRRISLYHAAKDIKYGSKRVRKNEFFALAGNKMLDVAPTLETVALQVVDRCCKEAPCGMITLFYGKDISDEYMMHLAEKLAAQVADTEVAAVATREAVCGLTIIFE